MDGLLMCKVYFHTGFLAPNTSCVKFKLRELDGAVPDKFGPEFKAVVNFRPEKEAARTQPVRADWELSLIFNSKADYELNRSMLFGDQLPSPSPSPPPPQAPPRAHRAPPAPPKPERSRTPSPTEQQKPAVGAELLIDPRPKAPPLPPKLISETVSLARPASDTLLLDLGFGSSAAAANPSVACTNPSVDILLNLSGSGSSASSRPHDPFFKPAGQVKTVSSSADIFGSGSGSNSPDLFGSAAAASSSADLLGSGSGLGAMPDLFSETGPKNHSSGVPDLFGPTMSAPIPDLFGAPSRPSHASPIPDLFGSSSTSTSASKPPDLFSDNLLGSASTGPKKPVLSPTSAFPSKPAMTVGEELISNLLGDLDMKSSNAAKSGPTAKAGSASQHQRKPNYNSAFFQAPSQPHKPKTRLAEDTFNDLLGGFSASNGNSQSGA